MTGTCASLAFLHYTCEKFLTVKPLQGFVIFLKGSCLQLSKYPTPVTHCQLLAPSSVCHYIKQPCR